LEKKERKKMMGIQAVKFGYAGKVRHGVVVMHFKAKNDKMCWLVKLTNGQTKTFHVDKITSIQYLY
jgi:hypothetical protein